MGGDASFRGGRAAGISLDGASSYGETIGTASTKPPPALLLLGAEASGVGGVTEAHDELAGIEVTGICANCVIW